MTIYYIDTSSTGSVKISIDKTDNNFYSFDENG